VHIVGAKKIDIDAIADKLIYLGALGKSMPPAWDGARVSVPVVSLEGDYLGRVLPGRGLYLDQDLKSVGILKKLPYVYERTPVQKILDFVKDERWALKAAALVLGAYLTKHNLHPLALAAITSYDGIVAARAGGNAQDLVINKGSVTATTSAWHSLMGIVVGFPAAFTFSNIPTGVAPTNASTGAWSFGLSNPSGGNKAYLLTFGVTASSTQSMYMLVDILVAAGNITANVATTAQTVSSTALTRYTSGAGVMMTYEVTTALGATPANITVNYTDQGGTSGQSTGAIALTASAIVGRLMPATIGPFMQLAAGDFGVQAVASATIDALMGAGVLALELYFPLTFIPGVAPSSYIERDSTNQIDGIVEIAQTSGAVLGCLGAYVFAGGANTGVFTGFLRTCQG
jgi:hypothetical protein